MKNKKGFKLSSQGRIASAVSMALVLPMLSVAALADNIKPVGETSVSQVGQVDVVNIANPNSKGLSHNQYKDFNVSEAGAVLNNSLQSGESQLAGQLDANGNLSESASVILNEVVSKNPSLLLGQQEVFGMAADYILANPNGISGDNIGFINTKRASLVVGKPTIEEERLAGFSVGDRNNKALQLNGEVDGDKRLDLLAPKIDINGDIKASEAINVISGRNNIDYETLEVSDHERLQPRVTLDGQILGSMNSGRIRLHNTDDEATQILQGQFNATDSLEAAADNLKVVDSEVSAREVGLKGSDQLYIGGVVATDRKEQPTTEQQLDDKVTLTHSGYQETQSFEGSKVSGGMVDLSGAELAVEGSQITADSINATGDNISFDGVTTTDTNSTTARNSKGLWFNEEESLDQTQAYHQSSLKASGDIAVNSTADMSLSGTAVEGKNITLTSGNDLLATSAVTENSHSDINRYKNETADLKSGAHTLTEASQNGIQTTLVGDKVSLSSEGEQRLEGVQLSANTAELTSGKDLTVAASSTSNRQTDEEDFKYWGGIGGGETHIDNHIQSTLTGSQINAGKTSVSSANNVAVNGSSVQGSNELAVNAKGDLNISHDFATKQDYTEDRHGTAFNITDKKSVTDSLAQTTVASNLVGKEVNLSGENIAISGSDVSAAETLKVNADSKLTTSAANPTDIIKTETYNIESEGGATSNIDLKDDFNNVLEQGVEGVLNGSVGNLIDKGVDQLTNLNVDATGSLKGVTTLTTKGTGSSRNSSITANNANLTAQDISIDGTNINAINNVAIEGNNINTGASNSLTAVDSKVIKSTGPEAYIRGGATGVEVGASIGHNQIIDEHSEYEAANTSIDAGGYATLRGTESVTNQGTQISADNVELAGQDIVNQASYDRIIDRDVVAGGDAALEFFAGGFVNADSKPLGGGIALSGDGKGVTTEQSSAHTTVINATNNANITAANTAVDEGTRIDAKDITIKADDYKGTAAYNSTVTTAHSGRGDVDVSAGTSNFVDVNVAGGGSGEYQYLQTGKADAVKGSLNADNIAIDAGTRAVAAQDVTATNDYMLTAGEEARIGQDSDKQWTTAGGADLGASTGLTIIPATAATGVVVGAPSFAGNAGFNYLNEEDAEAKTATINTKNLKVSAGQLAQIEGATVDSNTVSIKGNRANIAAAQDTHRAVGVAMGGNGGFSLDIAEAITSSDDIGVGANLGVVNETSNKAKGATINSNSLNVSANEAGDALVVEGANITAQNVKLTNTNEQGNVAITAAESQDYVGNFDISANLGGAADAEGFASDVLGAQLNVETDNSRYYTLGAMNADNIDINTGKDINLQSNLEAKTLNTTAGNQLVISSAQDNVAKVNVNTGLAVDGSPIKFATDATGEDILGALKEDFDNGTILGVSVAGNAGFNVDHQQATHQATVSADNFNANVGSDNIEVKAAKVKSANANLGNASVNSSNNDDFVHKVGASIKGETFSIPKFAETIPGLVADALQGNPIDLDIPVEADVNYEWDDVDGPQTKSDVSF